MFKATKAKTVKEYLHRRRMGVFADQKYLNDNKIGLLREGMPFAEWKAQADEKILKMEEIGC